MILRDQMALFACGRTLENQYRHSFIGGRIEDGEDPEAALLRELAEEACLNGTLLFRIPEPNQTNHYTYLVDIGQQEPQLGANPEETGLPFAERHLQRLIWLDLNILDNFTEIDRRYFALLLKECERRRYRDEWSEPLYRMVGQDGALQD